jgi:hypothetical protein
MMMKNATETLRTGVAVIAIGLGHMNDSVSVSMTAIEGDRVTMTVIEIKAEEENDRMMILHRHAGPLENLRMIINVSAFVHVKPNLRNPRKGHHRQKSLQIR